ncbi:unnamed protein product, partial [Meganyctiphanes norvegica]
MGATDAAEESVWRHQGTGQILNRTYFPEGHKNGGIKQNCVYMHRETGAWEDRACLQLLESFTVCQTNHTSQLRLRGLCSETMEMNYYSFRPDYTNGKPIFQGHFGNIIYSDGNGTWILFDAHRSITLADLSLTSSDQYPIGWHTWILR